MLSFPRAAQQPKISWVVRASALLERFCWSPVVARRAASGRITAETLQNCLPLPGERPCLTIKQVASTLSVE